MLFSEGGQPLYIDDLKTLQENPANQMSVLLRVLGGNTSAFLLNRFQGEFKDTEQGQQIIFQTKKNWLVLEGTIYEINETTLTVNSWTDPLYVGDRRLSSEVRTFEDGQERACRETAEAFLTLEKTEGVFNVNELKTLSDLMASMIAYKIPEKEYKDVNVNMLNGYFGILQERVEPGYRIIKVNLQSNNSEWSDGKGILFEYATTRALNSDKLSSAFIVGEGVNIENKQIVHIFMSAGKGCLVGNNGVDKLPSPIHCPINTYFIIPN